MSRNTDVGRRFMEAIAADDRQAIGECLADDCTLWYNYAGQVQRGGPQVADHAVSHRRALREMQYLDVRRFDTGEGYVQQATIRGVTNSGTEFHVPVCLVGRVNGRGLIDALWEYLDPAQVLALHSELDH